MTSWIAIPLAGLTVVSTLAGGLLALRLRDRIGTIIAFSGGIVVAVALFDVLPEAIDAVDDGKRVGGFAGLGFLVFFLAHRLLVLHHRDPDEQAKGHAQVGALGAAGLSIHSFVDGLGIGLAFNLNTATGLLVFVAVVSHDFADGLNTVSFVLRQGGTIERARSGSPSTRSPPCSARSSAPSCSTSPSRARHAARAIRRLFPLHGRERPLARGARASVLAACGLTVTGFAVIFVISLALNA